jgi:hypothetical protein
MLQLCLQNQGQRKRPGVKIKIEWIVLTGGKDQWNYTYYDMAAMKLVNDVLKKIRNNFEGLTFKALIFLSQHHFAEGLAVAEQVKTTLSI